MTGSDDSGPFAVTRGWCSACENYRHHSFAGMTCYCGNGVIEETTLVPIAELERLADEWDVEGTDAFFEGQHAMGDGEKMQWANHLGQEQAFEQCADELQELIAEYGGPDE